MMIVEIDGEFREIKSNDEALRIAREHPDARFHRLHFRKDIGMFEDEVLTSGVKGIDYRGEE